MLASAGVSLQLQLVAPGDDSLATDGARFRNLFETPFDPAEACPSEAGLNLATETGGSGGFPCLEPRTDRMLHGKVGEGMGEVVARWCPRLCSDERYRVGCVNSIRCPGVAPSTEAGSKGPVLRDL